MAAALISAGASILVAIVSLVGVIVTNNHANDKMVQKIEISQAVTDEKIDTLRKNVEKHNSIVERTFKLEEKQAVLEEQLKVANHRLSDLEKKG